MAYVLKEGTTGFEGTSDADATAIRAGLAATGFVIKTKAIYDQEQQSAIDEAFSKRNKQIEDTILEVTGIPKNADEKYFDYLKRSVPAKLAVISDLEKKIAKLEKDGVDPKGLAKELQERLDSLTNSHKKEKGELLDRIQTFESQNFTSKIDIDIAKAIDKLRPTLKEMDAAFANDVIERRIQKFKSENVAKQIEGGIIVFNGPDGKARRRDTDAQPAGVEELIGSYFSDLVDPGRKQTGAGSGPAKPGDMPKTKEGKIDWAAVKPGKEVDSKMKLNDWLKTEHKLSEDSQDFANAFTAITKANPEIAAKFK